MIYVMKLKRSKEKETKRDNAEGKKTSSACFLLHTESGFNSIYHTHTCMGGELCKGREGMKRKGKNKDG